ncbi:DUF3240 family protein [Thiohalorhabdus methylotrophus]|uniref:DUF3240 family protein n=1 Tax=Thiohalorhabdus methylotrophus TaxID=3242694 RepID=A0ABV4TX58_9GAMM
MDSCILALLAPPELRDNLTDWLLAFHEALTFTSQQIDHYGAHPGTMSAGEQVTGSQRKLLVRVRTPREAAEEILAGLRVDFPQAGLEYWITPLEGMGRIG